MMAMTKRALVSGIASWLVLLSAFTVKAEDFTFPGIACRWNGPINQDSVFVPLNISEIQNGSSVFTYGVVCPATNTNNGRSVRGVLNASISASWDHTACTFALNTYDGFTYYAWPTPGLTQVGQSYQFLWQFANFSSAWDYSSYAFLCNVPPGQSIYKYDVGR
jgi:hypothetical protein